MSLELRFEDYLEMSVWLKLTNAQSAFKDAAGAAITGTQGLFSTIEDRGLVYNDPDFSVNSSRSNWS